jgi:hypothetical protein
MFQRQTLLNETSKEIKRARLDIGEAAVAGKVMVRSSWFIDPKVTQAGIICDPLPQIEQGLPLDVRDTGVNTSRVGAVVGKLNDGAQTSILGPWPLRNIVPPSNVPVRVVFDALGTVVTLDATARSGSHYAATVR